MPRPPIRNRPSSALTAERPAHLPHPSAPFHPLADTTTYKDLLLFEERLKMNAQMLNRRRRRYEAFLVTLVISIGFLAHRAVFRPSELHLVRYLTKGLLAVALVTLVLFFASGMYQERIAYANKYVPHANRQLRSINMHLNMRRSGGGAGGLGRWLVGWGRWMGGMKMGELEIGAEGEKERLIGGSITPTSTGTSTPTGTSSTPQLIPPIPPTTNPRGELIFSSRVHPHFKEGYERYRAAFERRRGEKIREERWRRSWFFIRWFLDPPEGKSAVSTGQSNGVTQGRRGTLGVNHQGQRSRSNSPNVNPSAHPTMSNPTMSSPLDRRASPALGLALGPASVRRTPEKDSQTFESSDEKSPLHAPLTTSTSKEERIKRDRSESYTFILGKGDVDKHVMGGGKRDREGMRKVDEESR